VEAEELLERDGRSWRRIGEEDIDLRPAATCVVTTKPATV
jgi:hypothetical protein